VTTGGANDGTGTWTQQGIVMIRKVLPQNDSFRGVKILHDPVLNKGTAFTLEERQVLGLSGLLPPRIHTQKEQVTRVMENIRNKASDLDRYIYLIALQDRNENLFYRVVMDHIEELMPIIYTPTVGEACQLYGHIFRRSRGLYISLQDRGHIADILRNWPHGEARIIVVTDGERILGLGDLGADGMGIPVGKLALYTACAGIDPPACLPVTLDTGTNNRKLLKDPLYLGVEQERVRGDQYDEFIEEFIRASQQVFPNILIQLEDFANINAFPLLRKYRDRACLFDDDIQGTGSVALAGLYSAARITGSKLSDQKILFLGAGEAGIGIGDVISAALVNEGLSLSEARQRCWFVDSKGLIVADRGNLTEFKQRYAHEHPQVETFLEAVITLQPTAIVGVSGQPNSFSREVVEAMCRINSRPIIFALSNPTSKSECTAKEAYTWSAGQAVFASGSPFDPVELDGRTIVPGQGNNAYIFPGVGLGVLVSRATRATDEMFFEAAKALADQVLFEDLAKGRIYPSLNRIREVSAGIAEAVANVAYRNGLTEEERPADLVGAIQREMYYPDYPSYV
jgi:malate dehydrogenase (oxaloacetate-decarboxylating)(NADP+)